MTVQFIVPTITCDISEATEPKLVPVMVITVPPCSGPVTGVT